MWAPTVAGSCTCGLVLASKHGGSRFDESTRRTIDAGSHRKAEDIINDGPAPRGAKYDLLAEHDPHPPYAASLLA